MMMYYLGKCGQVKKQGCRIDLCVYAPIFDGQGDFFEIICFNIQPQIDKVCIRMVRRICMLQNKTIKKITGLLLALFLIAGQFFVEGASVQAVGKQKALNITDLSLSVGQSQKLKVLNGKKVRWSSSKKTVASVSKKEKRQFVRR